MAKMLCVVCGTSRIGEGLRWKRSYNVICEKCKAKHKFGKIIRPDPNKCEQLTIVNKKGVVVKTKRIQTILAYR